MVQVAFYVIFPATREKLAFLSTTKGKLAHLPPPQTKVSTRTTKKES